MPELYKKLNKIRTIALWSAVLCVSAIFFIFVCIVALTIWVLVPILIVLITAPLWISFASKYKELYKDEVVSEILKTAPMLTDVEYDKKNGITSDEIDEIGMMSTGTFFKSDDRIIATYKNVRFDQSDVNITRKSGKSTVTIFRGRIISLDFFKNFSSDMQVSSTDCHFENNMCSAFNSDKPFEKIKLENEEFNQKFIIRAENQLETFYIMTPQFTQAVMDLYTQLECPLLLMFSGNKLYVAIHTGEVAFEPSLFEAPDPDSDKKKILGDLEIITQFIEALDLGNDYFKHGK